MLGPIREQPFLVKYMSVNNCFLYFPNYWLKRLNEINSYTTALKLVFGSKRAYFSWNTEPVNLEDSALSLSATYACSLGLSNEDTVFASLYSNVIMVHKAVISPVNNDDWEILEQSSEVLQSSILNQICIVWPGQDFVVWVSKSVHIVLHIESLEPECEVGRLGALTEVVVIPLKEGTSNNGGNAVNNSADHSGGNAVNNSADHKNSVTVENGIIPSSKINSIFDVPSDKYDYGNNSSVADGVPHNTKALSGVSFWKYLKNMSPFWFGEEERTVKSEEMEKTDQEDGSSTLSQYSMLRVHPYVCKKYLGFQPYCVFVHRTNWSSVNKSLYCKLTYLPFPPKPDDENIENKQFVFVKVHTIEDTIVTYSEVNCVLLPEVVQKTLCLKAGSRVLLEPAETSVNTRTLTALQVTITGIWDESVDDVEMLLRIELLNHSMHSPVLITSGALFPLHTKAGRVQYVVISLLPLELQYVLLDSVDIQNSKIIVDPNISQDSSINTELEDSFKLKNMSFSWANDIVAEGLCSLEICLGIQPSLLRQLPSWPRLSIVNTLIIGNCGSGRSTLARLLCSEMSRSPYFVHTVEFQCRHLKGKKSETVHKLLSTSLLECVYYQPSVLFLDDIDELASATSAEQESFQEVAYHSRVAEVISLLVEEFQATNSIAVIATASSASKLNPALISSHGCHIFKTVLQVPELTKAGRLSILQNIISAANMAVDNSVDVESVAQRCEGYVVQDLVDVCDRAVFEALKRNVSISEQKMPVILENADFESALKNTTPLSLQGIELYRGTDHSWQSVGGLAEVKETLTELLMWPSQYPELYAQSPLRQQTGILLYGAPGTGKTLLAGALASECDLNFISVKGPELLSKYIGASEESVRDVFQKAQGAKPCILFFDEFESLAPRRGHDSTGVTDRVVNQLLTQLDGVESLVGVWVMAASNRPDLLDPALLRPGRFDRCIECPLPDQMDRLAILTTLSCKLHLADDVDLDELARCSDSFTGADLQAVLCTAHLMAVENKWGKQTSEDDGGTRSSPAIDQQILLAALKDTRPSLTPKERRKYDIINKKFSNSRGAGGPVEDFSIMQQRATLA